MIDLILIVMGWLAIVSINGGHRDHEQRLKRLERQIPKDTDKLSCSFDREEIEITED